MTTPERPFVRSGRVVVFAAFALGALVLAAATPGSTQGFGARVAGHLPKPVACPGGASLCGSADIAGYGAASFDLFLTAFGASSGSCGVYTQLADYRAVVFFRLEDGSTLTLDEAERPATQAIPGLPEAALHRSATPARGVRPGSRKTPPASLRMSLAVVPTPGGAQAALSSSPTPAA